MAISYKLNKDIIARTAAMLNWNLSTVKSSVNVVNKEGRMVNGKSLVGILSGGLREGDQIKVLIEKEEDVNKIKSCFNEVGKEII